MFNGEEPEEYSIVLLAQYGINNCGDVIKVGRGIFNTLIKLKKAIYINDFDYDNDDNLDSKEKLAIVVKKLKKENEELTYIIFDLRDEIEDLKRR